MCVNDKKLTPGAQGTQTKVSVFSPMLLNFQVFIIKAIALIHYEEFISELQWPSGLRCHYLAEMFSQVALVV